MISNQTYYGLPMARLLLVFTVALALACNSNQPPPSPSPGPSPGETITGRERIGWDQSAGSATELATFRYAIYVDGVRSVIADVTCAATAGSAGFACSGRLPTMVPGTHTLEIAAFIESGGIIEGAKSAPLRVTVSGNSAPEPFATTLRSGDQVLTDDGVGLVVELLQNGIDDPSDLALAPDGRVFVGERKGSIRVISASGPLDALPPANEEYTGVLALTLAPDFLRSGHLFAAHAVWTPDGEHVRVVRYRAFGDHLVERMVLLPDIPAPSSSSAALRFGPDGRLYAAFESMEPEAAERLSDWRGKILRLEADGRTPDDQPAASPVFWTGLHSPRGLDWSADTTLLWIAEHGADGRERLRAIGVSDERPRRTRQRSSYVLPEAAGVGPVVSHPGAGIPEFGGDLFVAAREGGYLLRVRFDATEQTRALSSERLLEGKVEGVRAVAADRHGALYFAMKNSLWRLTSARPPGRGSR